MTRVKSTKRALIVSALALLVCVSMLVGSTFAWFTDSVTSVNNIIKSGILDIVMEYSTDGINWTEVGDETSIFNDESLWEPGHTEAVALRVKNVGTLAFDYDLSTYIYLDEEGINVYGDEFYLSDYLTVHADIVADEAEAAAILADRESAIAMTEYDLNALVAGTEDRDVLEPGDENIVCFAVTMPTTVGNEANHRSDEEAPYIRFGIYAYARQVEFESDSFGIDYDEDSEFEILPTAWVTDDGTITAHAETLFGDAIFNNRTEKRDEDFVVDAAYTFITNDAGADIYQDWIADYEITCTADLPEDAVYLLGQYFNNEAEWQGFLTPAVEANKPYPLLGSVGYDLTFEQVFSFVETFKCGVTENPALNAVPAGTEMTVALKIYKYDDPSAEDRVLLEEHTVGMFTYTFK